MVGLPTKRWCARFFLSALLAVVWLWLGMQLDAMGALHAQCGSLALQRTDITSGCAPSVVNFELVGMGGVVPDSVRWAQGNGTVLTGLLARTLSYANPGLFVLTVTVFLPDGSQCQLQDSVRVLPSSTPFVGVVDPPNGLICRPGQAFTLAALLPTDAVAWDWLVNNQRQTTPTITLAPNQPGPLIVQLTVTNSAGCIASTTQVLNIPQPPTPNVLVELLDSCPPIRVRYTLQPSNQPPATSNWTFAGGTPATATGLGPHTVTYPTGTAVGAVQLRLTNTQGCTDSLTISTPLPTDTVPTPALTVVRNRACLGEPNIRLDHAIPLPPGVVVSWETSMGLGVASSNAAGANFVAAIPGNYTVRVRYTNGSCSRLSPPVTVVVEGLVADFDAPLAELVACAPPLLTNFAVSSSSQAPGATYIWTIRDSSNQIVSGPTSTTNPVFPFTFTQRNLYSIELIVVSSNGCRDTLLRPNFVSVLTPLASFTIPDTQVCVGEQTGIQSTTPPLRANYTRRWVFINQRTGQRFNGSGLRPNFRPQVTGRYDVLHYVDLEGECPDSVLVTSVFEVEGVNFALSLVSLADTAVCQSRNFTVRHTIIDRNPAGSTVSWSWESNPPGVSVINTQGDSLTTLRFPLPGTYQLSATASSLPSGCSLRRNLSRPITVGMFDTLVGPDTVCAFVESTFESRSLLLPANQFAWSVTPANGATLVTQGARQGRFVFSQPGTYRIQVVGRNTPANCQATATHTVQVIAPPLDFTTPDTRQDCAPKTFDFTALAPTALQYTWNFGDGTPAITTSDSLISHRYLRNGRYDVTLSVVDAQGCTNTLTKPAYVHVAGPQPRLELSSQSGCDSVTITFTNLSLDADSLWFELGDGTPLNTSAFRTSNQLTHTYRFPPNTTANDSVFVFYPLLFLQDAAGCDVLFSDSLNLRVELRRAPQLSITADPKQGCSPLVLQPVAQTRYADRVLWYLDNDPTPVANGWAPTLMLEAVGGNRDVILRAEAWHVDCRTEVSDTIRVWALPELAYVASTDSICPDDILTLTYTGPAFNLPLQSVSWTLPDGSQQTGETIQYAVRRQDANAIRLAVTDANGCVSDGGLPVAWALYDWQPNVRLTAPTDTATRLFAPARIQGELTAPDVLDVQWWLNGNPAASGRLFDLTLPDTGRYTLTALLITANGCPDTIRIGTYQTLPLKFFAPNVFTPNGDGVNDRFAVEYEGDGTFTLWIYDRQGQLMFRSESVQQQWDGTRGGKPAIAGTYFYVVEAGGRNFAGSFSLIR